MRLTDLVEFIRGHDLEERSDGRRPPRDNVRAVQNALSVGLADEEFYLDCIDLELDAIQRRRNGDIRAVLQRIPERQMNIRMYYWPVGKAAQPHEHTKWTVTAVFFNSLQVTTYDWDVARRERRLLQKNVFRAEQGQVGHIYDRCIHNPANTGGQAAASIHVFNDSDMPLLEQEVGPINGMGNPRERTLPTDPEARAQWIERASQNKLKMLARALARFRTPRAEALLNVISGYADAATLEQVVRTRRRIRYS
jgi:predicted metal-dependent enzyme (double-stranded beta helix superfamily)